MLKSIIIKLCHSGEVSGNVFLKEHKQKTQKIGLMMKKIKREKKKKLAKAPQLILTNYF